MTIMIIAAIPQPDAAPIFPANENKPAFIIADAIADISSIFSGSMPNSPLQPTRYSSLRSLSRSAELGR